MAIMGNTEHLPTRHLELIIVALVMMTLNIFFTIWRIVVRSRSLWTGSSDWLMILGALVSNAGMAITVLCGFNGAGRLLRDPFWQPNAVEKMVYQNHLTFVSQLLNVYGMLVVKLSICAYLLSLDFSRTYRWVVWGTIVFATIFNFLLPVTQHFGLCRPLASRWDTRITNKHCWSQLVRITLEYTQAISNVVTDLVYATAPIAYLCSVQLSRRAQWGVRAVFLMSLVCTVVSALKLWDFHRIQGRKEVYYESATLSIWSMAEVSIGIIVANLPPLRRSFDGIFKSLYSSVIWNKNSSTHKPSVSHFEGFKLPTYRVGHQDESWSRVGANSGGDLHDVELESRGRNSSISRTTKKSIDHGPGLNLRMMK